VYVVVLAQSEHEETLMICSYKNCDRNFRARYVIFGDDSVGILAIWCLMFPWVCTPRISTNATPSPNLSTVLIRQAPTKPLGKIIIHRVVRKAILVHGSPRGRLY